MTARPSTQCELFIAFVRNRHELAAHFDAVAQYVSRQTLWLAWPKKVSGTTWSGLAFKRRK